MHRLDALFLWPSADEDDAGRCTACGELCGAAEQCGCSRPDALPADIARIVANGMLYITAKLAEDFLGEHDNGFPRTPLC